MLTVWVTFFSKAVSCIYIYSYSLFAFISGVILYRLFYNLLLSLNSIPQRPFHVMIYTSISCPLTVLYFKHSFVEKSNLINSFWRYLLRNVVCVYAIAFLVLPSMDRSILWLQNVQRRILEKYEKHWKSSSHSLEQQLSNFNVYLVPRNLANLQARI